MEKRYILIPSIIVLVLLLGAAGFILSRTYFRGQSSHQTESSSSTSSSSSSKVGSEISGSKIENHSVDERLKIAPDITSLDKQIQDNEVVYIAKAGNGYGIETGKYAGMFKEDVIVGSKEVGGVALVPNVVQKILNDELAKIPTGQDKLKVIMPLDMAETKSADVDISTLDVKGIVVTTYIKIDCSEKVDVYNIIPDSKNLVAAWVDDGNASKMGVVMDIFRLESSSPATNENIMSCFAFLLEKVVF